MSTVNVVAKLGRAVATAALVAVTGGSGGNAWAQAQGGNINSIVVQAFDANTGLPIDMHAASTGLYNGARVRLIAHAYDAMGNSLACTPSFEPRPGVAGGQLTFSDPLDDKSVIMDVGQGFGTTEFTPSCREFPNFTGTPVTTAVMAPGTNLGTAQAGLGLRRTPPSDASPPATGGDGAPGQTASPAPAKGGSGGAIALGILGGLAIVGAVAYGVTALSETEEENSCPTYSDYCGGGNSGGVKQSGCACPSGTNQVTCGCGGLYPSGTVLCNCQ